MSTLYNDFVRLSPPEREGAIRVQAAEQGSKVQVGRTGDGHPVVLFELDGETVGAAPRRLANLRYRPPTDVSIVEEDGSERGARLAVLELRSVEAALARYFLRIVGSVLVSDEVLSDASSFERTLDSVVSLFRAIARPARRTVQGVWAELAVIRWASDPAVALACWHSSTNALFDFTSTNDHLEVKGVASALREHHFRREQLIESGDGRTLVASTLLEEHQEGATILDLVEEIGDLVSSSGEVICRLEGIVASGLGQEWRTSERLRFDRISARESLRVYEVSAIPQIPGPIPEQIKQIHFTVDLSSTPSIPLVDARALSDFFAAVLPDA